MVMNSDNVSLKSFDVKKINIESVVINMMLDSFFETFPVTNLYIVTSIFQTFSNVLYYT